MKKYKIKGSSLIVAVMISIIFAIMVSGLVFMVRSNSNEVFKNIEETRLFYEAEAEAKVMLRRLSIPDNYNNPNYSYKKTIDGMQSGVKVTVETAVNPSGGFFVISTATRGGKSVTITIQPKSDPLLGPTLISLAKFGGVFRPGFLAFGDVEMTGKPRITLGYVNGKLGGPEFYGVVKVNMNNPYNPNNNESGWWWDFYNKPWSAFEQAGVTPTYLPLEKGGYCNFSQIAGATFTKGLLIAEGIEGGGDATKLYTNQMKDAFMNIFKGDLDLSKAFNSNAPAINPAVLIDSYYKLTKNASKVLNSSTSNKILPFVAGVASGQNSRQNVKIEFKGGEALITVLNKDLVTSTPLKVSQANTKVLVIPKEYGDVYVKGEVSSDFTLVTEKDNIIIEDDLYTSDYKEFLTTNPDPTNYSPETDSHVINQLKKKKSVAKLALIPAHNDTLINKNFNTWVAYNGRSSNWVRSAYDSFTNESFYSGDNTSHTGQQSYMPTQGTVKIVKNAATDNSSSTNPLLVTAAIYAKNSSMTTFKGESSYETLRNQYASNPASGQYSIIEKNWHDAHDADKIFSNYNNLVFVGSYLGYDFPATYRTTGSVNKGLRPLYISSATFRDGMLPPGFTPNGGSGSSAKFKPDKEGLIAFEKLKWSVKR